MSEANIQGQNLDFNIGFLTKSKTDKESETEYARVDAGALTYLEIEDNLLNVGLTGSVSVKNPFQILDRIKALRNTEDTLYLNVNIEDKNSQVKSIVDKKVSFLALIENSASISKNILDNEIVFKFEEAQTSMLKKTSMRKIFTEITTSKVDVLGALMKSVIEGWTTAINEGEGSTLIDEDNFRSESGGQGNIISFCDNIGDSVYDVLMRLAGCVHIDDKLLPILKIQSIEGADGQIDRMFTFKEIFTERHREFLKTVGTTGASNNSDVYLEEFVISPEDDNSAGINSSGMFNTVETYDMLKADIAVARDSFWGDYQLDMGNVDISNTNINLLTLPDIVDNFEANDLGVNKFYSSIPVLSQVERKIIKSERKVNTTDNNILRDYAFNRTKRSFLFLNDVIIFTVKGQVFRKPGSFITINGGDVIGSTIPNNIWLVISVKHIFKELNYENEVAAVRLFGNSNKYSTLVGEEVSSGSAGGSSGGGYYAPEGSFSLSPVNDFRQAGVVNRSKINKELQEDEDLQRLLYASVAAEVGTQGEEAQQAYMETVMNRSAASGRSLRATLSDTGYYPDSTTNKLSRPNPPNYRSLLDKVLAGSNISNFATDNASNEKGNPLARNRINAGNPGLTYGGDSPGGEELFYSNYYGSGDGGVKYLKVWRDGQIASVAMGNTGK